MPLNISIPFSGQSGNWIIPCVLFYSLVWLLVLGAALVRSDFDPVTKLTWVVVIIFVPVFGALFYLVLAAPAREVDSSNPLSGTPWENDPGYTSKKP